MSNWSSAIEALGLWTDTHGLTFGLGRKKLGKLLKTIDNRLVSRQFARVRDIQRLLL